MWSNWNNSVQFWVSFHTLTLYTRTEDKRSSIETFSVGTLTFSPSRSVVCVCVCECVSYHCRLRFIKNAILSGQKLHLCTSFPHSST